MSNNAPANSGQGSDPPIPGTEVTGAQDPAALRRLAALQQLTLEACLAENRSQLAFRILNRTILLCPYERALLWDLRRRPWKLLGISGERAVNHRAPLVESWTRAARSLPAPERLRVLTPAVEAGAAAGQLRDWLRRQNLSVLWVPLKTRGETACGLWLQRPARQAWSPQEQQALSALGAAYGAAWGRLERPWPRLRGRGTQACLLAAAAVILLLLAFLRLPLRVVAPCEVVPIAPRAVTAPLAGVIREVRVQPGERVERGQELARYEDEVLLERYREALQQVRVARARLERTRVLALTQPRLRAEVALLQEQVKAEQARLAIARFGVHHASIVAPAAGVVVMDDPAAWRGKPVQVGESIMLVVDPTRSRLRVWVAPADNIAFDPKRRVRVVLGATPGSSHAAVIKRLGLACRTSPNGAPAFPVDCAWTGTGGAPGPRIGLSGTAVLYGPRVRLWYWLGRKPLGAARMLLGR